MTLFPVIRDGLDAFAAAAVQVRDGVAQQKLRVTTTNAFAGRWLVPRMPISVSAQSCGCTSTNNNEILSYMWRGTARPLHSKQQGLGMVAEEHPFRDCCELDRETKSFRWEFRWELRI